MRFVDVIASKRDGHALSKDEIDHFVAGTTARTIPDYQASALLMAIVLRGMTVDETAWLTQAMLRSGSRLDLSDIPGVKVGKHSTGGVGDKVSIVLGPLAAACGVVVPKMSGRGLGHSGGTIDKLESIPGFRTDLDAEAFRDVLADVGVCFIGSTASLVPADKILYALRDVTATIESVPLIAASIMSKKLAEGCDALLLDVKCGDGAFMNDLTQARALAESMVRIGGHAGVHTEACITDMDTPLGHAIGNALEIRECLETLKHRGPEDLTALVVRFAAMMIVMAGLEPDVGVAADRARSALANGSALRTFRRLIERQGGDPRVVVDDSLLADAPDHAVVKASRAGLVTALRAGALGRASGVLGASRGRVGEAVDHAVGVVTLVRVGDQVSGGQALIELHHRDGRGLETAMTLCEGAIAIGDETVSHRGTVPRDRVLEVVR